MHFYEVGHGTDAVRFTSKFLAARYANEKNLNVRFDLHDKEFDAVDWTKEPDLTWDQLLDIRARQIEAKKKPIVIAFSGGTDSYTIYKVFERNNIHISMIFFRKRPDHSAESFRQVDELLRDHKDKSTIILKHEDYIELLEDGYSSEDWVWEGKLRIQFAKMGGGDSVTVRQAEKTLGTSDFILVTGLEKPRLEFTDQGVFSFQEDQMHSTGMNYPGRYDSFYISPELPELHVKQSYMLKNYIRSLNPNAVHSGELKEYSKAHTPTFMHWHDFSIKGCGRFGDLNYSHLQHLGNHATKLIMPKNGNTDVSHYQGRGAKWAKDIAKTHPHIYKNYINGLLSFYNDSAGKYNLFTDNIVVDRSIYSKKYKLTF